MCSVEPPGAVLEYLVKLPEGNRYEPMTEFPTIHRHFPDLQIQYRDINMAHPSANVNIFQAAICIPS